MKIAFTTCGDDFSAPMDYRFGRASRFLIYDTDKDSFGVVVNEGADSAQGAGLKAAETVVKSGAGALATGECGPKALRVLVAAGVKVYSTDAATVGDALGRYRAGRLTETSPA
jgi:predicted Fe-Mo cluster-binding NifX family protein